MRQTLLLLAGVILLLQVEKSAKGQLTGQVPLNPKSVPQFVDPLPHFAGQRVDAAGQNLVIRYMPTDQVAVSTGTVLGNGVVGTTPGAGVGHYWGYSLSNDGINFTPPMWPAFTVEAHRGIPLNVRYENKLNGESYAKVNMVADQTLHWADPFMVMDMMNMAPYDGPIPVSPHLHGGEVASESDGGPNSWFTPDYGITGPSWGMDGTDENYYYPNTQEEATLWYHDHGLGVTRLNVYAGLAGFYFLRGPLEEANKLPGWSGDDLVQEVAPPGKSGVFNPKPYLPEIEMAIQDRMFDTNGQLYFPNLPTNPMVHPYWTPEFIGNIITVNGKTWPYLSVAPRKYRFRIVNGSNARFYELWLQGQAAGQNAPSLIQIGTDGGLLDAPVIINPNRGGKLLLAPGERADLVIDFSKSTPGAVWILSNSAKVPYPNGTSPNPSTVGQVMQFVVNGQMVSAVDPTVAGTDKSLLPATLRPVPLVKLTTPTGGTTVVPALKRQLTLNEVMGMGGPLEVLLNNSRWDMNGMMTPGLGETELPVEGTTELWQIINTTADAHPIHLHLVQFQLVSRQAFSVNNFNKAYNKAFTGGMYQPSVGPPLPYNQLNTDGAIGGNPAISAFLQGKPRLPNPNENGWKDTYVVYPGEVTTFAIRYAPTDIPVNAPLSSLMFGFDPSLGPGYVWHCHIIDHEDNEMMRPYAVLPSPLRPTPAFGSKLKSGKVAGGSSDAVQSEVLTAIGEFSLGQNYPNPFNGITQIRFNLPESLHIRLSLLNQLGQVIKVLIDAEAPAGNNTIDFDSNGLPKGVYYYQLSAGQFQETKKMIKN